MLNNMSGHLEFVEITYIQLDGTLFAVRTETIEGGFQWHEWISNLWLGLSHANDIDNETMKTACYSQLLRKLSHDIETHGHGFLPQSVRSAIHELQDHVGIAHTSFEPAV